jgi:cytochrome P450
LRAIINGAHGPGHGGTAEDFIVSNCKTMYFAGHESTAVTAIWCLMLLATHPEWQERARVEALEVCHAQSTLDVGGLQRLKIVSSQHPLIIL